MKITRDFVVGVYLVKDKKVLLVKHKKLGVWLPAGGHIEKDETPEESAVREVKEETGFNIELKTEKFHRIQILKMSHVEIHPINKEHEHINFTYFTKPIGGKLTLNKKEHDDLKWFSEEDLERENVPIEIKTFAKQAIAEVE